MKRPWRIRYPGAAYNFTSYCSRHQEDFFGVIVYAVSKGINSIKVMAEKNKNFKELMEISNVNV